MNAITGIWKLHAQNGDSYDVLALENGYVLAIGRDGIELWPDDLFGVTRPDAVWRAVDRHGAAYPGALQVVEIGKMKAARRDQLAGFARWYHANVRVSTSRWAGRQPGVVGEDDETAAGVAEVETAADLDARRAALREAISFIREVKEEADAFYN